MGKVKLSIGDWSQDGHNQSEYFVYEVNKTVKEIRQAYKDSCKLTGVQFNYNENYTGLPEHDDYGTPLHICTEHEDCGISDEAMKILVKHGIEMDAIVEDDCLSVDVFAELIMIFIKLSLPDLTWEEASFKKSELRDMEPINGWHNEDMNEQFGYGLFS